MELSKLEIRKIAFERDSNGIVAFNATNLDLLERYVLPIIEKNIGWDTADLTIEGFRSDPEKWRDVIDATVVDHIKGEVYIAMNDENPVGLLAFIRESFNDLSEKNFSKVLFEMLNSKESHYWEDLERFNLFDKELLNRYFLELKDFIVSKSLYRSFGIVLIPELQGKSSGVSDKLYEIMSRGFIYGWTSTPQIVSKHRKMCKHTLYFPPLGEKYSSLEDMACLTIVAARLFFGYPEVLSKFKFGVMTHKHFTFRDKEEYTKLSKSFLEKGKITQLDYERLEYILGFGNAEGVIISLN